MLAPLIAREALFGKYAAGAIQRRAGRVALVAIGGRAALELRPQAMDNKTKIGADGALLA